MLGSNDAARRTAFLEASISDAILKFVVGQYGIMLSDKDFVPDVPRAIRGDVVAVSAVVRPDPVFYQRFYPERLRPEPGKISPEDVVMAINQELYVYQGDWKPENLQPIKTKTLTEPYRLYERDTPEADKEGIMDIAALIVGMAEGTLAVFPESLEESYETEEFIRYEADELLEKEVERQVPKQLHTIMEDAWPKWWAKFGKGSEDKRYVDIPVQADVTVWKQKG